MPESDLETNLSNILKKSRPEVIGLGIRKLSSAPLVIPVVKYLIRQFNLEDLEELAEKAIKETSPSNVRELVKGFYKKSAITLPIM